MPKIINLGFICLNSFEMMFLNRCHRQLELPTILRTLFDIVLVHGYPLFKFRGHFKFLCFNTLFISIEVLILSLKSVFECLYLFE